MILFKKNVVYLYLQITILCYAMETNLHKLFVLFLLLTAGMGLNAQTTITHNIGTGNLIIAGNSTDNYIITGTTTTNYVRVETGYHGVITLRNLNITLAAGNISPIAVKGQNNCSNLTPVSNVDIILEGNNVLSYLGSQGCAAFQVEQGTQINISENPCTRGTLTATVSTNNANNGAGIGALNRLFNTNEVTAPAVVIGNCPPTYSPVVTAGGNIVISSGTITARGGHGAGIGGGFRSYYDGMIVIYGGIVHTSTYYHGAGIGSGCPNGWGVQDTCYTPNSTIIALPPAQISAIGADGSYTPRTNLGLAGTNYIIYIGDTAKPLVTVRTDDFEPYADIYVDLSQNPNIAGVFNAIIPQNRLDITKVKFGQTNASGLFQFHGTFNNNTTFFTDAISSQPSTLGRPYSPETVQLSSGGTVVLKRMLMNISLFPFPSIPLVEGYAAPQAFANACRLKITYNDAVPMTNIVFDIAGGAASDFSATDIKFYASDSTTLISPPTTLSRGNTIYAVIPLKTGKLTGYYTDIFRFIGNWNGSSTGYIRQTVGQYVYHIDTTKNICLGDSVLFNGKYYKETGFYYDTLQTGLGCDSIIAFHLVVHFPETSIYDTICLGDSILFGGKYYNQTGIYTDSLKMVWGCDSIVNLHLLVSFSDTNLYDTICSSDSVLFGGKYYNQTGIYVDTFQMAFGCDSIATLNLLVNVSNDKIIYDTICVSNLPYQLYGFNVSDSGYYSRTIANAVGCDSLISLYLTVTDTIYKEIVASICEGESYTKNGFKETRTGIYTRMEKAVQGCDTLIRLDLTVNLKPIFEIMTTGDLCQDGEMELIVPIDNIGYLWSTGDTTQMARVSLEGLYSVRVFTADCQTYREKEIICPCTLWLPNIFSPKNGEYAYIPVTTFELHSFQMIIYNRWGMIVYRTNEFHSWNGKDKEQDAAAGVYFCVVEYSCKDNPTKKRFAQSSITLIR